MTTNPLDSVRTELTRQGYDRNYIERLCIELEDHARCAAQERTRSNPEEAEIPQEIWAHMGLDRLVRSYLEMNTKIPPTRLWVRAAWMSTFAGMFMLTLAMLGLSSLWWISLRRPTWLENLPIARIHHELMIWLPMLAAIALSLLGYRYRLDACVLLAPIGLLSLSGVYRIYLVDCPGANSFYFHPAWEFSWIHSATPGIGLLIAWILHRFWLSRCENSQSVILADSQFVATQRIRTVAGATLPAIAFGVAILAGVFLFRAKTSVHPIDSLVRDMNSPLFVESFELQLLRVPKNIELLQLNGDQSQKINATISEFDKSIQKVRDQCVPPLKAWQPLRTEQIAAQTRDAFFAITESLTPTQRSRLKAILVTRLFPDSLLLDEIRKKLSLSTSQQLAIKNACLAKIKAENRIQSKIRKAGVAEGTGLRRQLDLETMYLHNSVRETLTPLQRLELERLL